MAELKDKQFSIYKIDDELEYDDSKFIQVGECNGIDITIDEQVAEIDKRLSVLETKLEQITPTNED